MPFFVDKKLNTGFRRVSFRGYRIQKTTPLPQGATNTGPGSLNCDTALQCHIHGKFTGGDATKKDFPPYTLEDPLVTIPYNTGFMLEPPDLSDYEKMNFHDTVGY